MSAMHPTLPGFFLTRQAANILEDLTREVHRAGSVHVIYGQSGTGKSTLIDYFIRQRLNTKDVLQIKLTSNHGFQLNDDPKSQSIDLLTGTVQQSVEQASIVVIDQLELMSKQLIEVLLGQLKSLSKHHSFSLILVCDSSMVATLNHHASELQLSIHGVELMPLQRDEQAAFLSASCCQGYRQKVSLSAAQNRQLKNTQGLYRDLVTLTQQPLKCDTSELVKTRWEWVSLLTGALLIIAMTVTGISWFNLDQPSQRVLSSDSATSLPVTAMAKQPAESLVLQNPEPAMVPEIVRENVATEPVENQIQSEPVDTVDAAVTTQPEIKSQDLTAPPSLFDKQFSLTRQWLQTASEQTASIQIMTLTDSIQSRDVLNDYLSQLQQQAVDISEIRIFSSDKRNGSILGVLYGQYRDRDQALAQIKLLPPALRANQPIPRTVRGIRNEIQR